MSVRCGNPVHKRFYEELTDEVHHHESVAQVRLCFARKDDFGLRSIEEKALLEQWDEEMRAEAEAEMAVERYYENRGAEEDYAFEEWEAARGVVPFHVAAEMAERARLGDEEFERRRKVEEEADEVGSAAFERVRRLGGDHREAQEAHDEAVKDFYRREGIA